MWSFLASLLAKLIEPFLIFWRGKQAGKREAELQALEERERRNEEGRRAIRDRGDLPPSLQALGGLG